ncbi:hypothetical protein CCACVL1_29267 [Corchorus capsularis]|uniref:Uncharacterized protein n=1 Tax=Corchorus capsularis TaxID=210143 RepID=A0A1R3G2N5_COCAP|nr:hypothetical protein CCACVL1_29267 [Corchorus capsularis]
MRYPTFKVRLYKGCCLITTIARRSEGEKNEENPLFENLQRILFEIGYSHRSHAVVVSRIEAISGI